MQNKHINNEITLFDYLDNLLHGEKMKTQKTIKQELIEKQADYTKKCRKESAEIRLEESINHTPWHLLKDPIKL